MGIPVSFQLMDLEKFLLLIHTIPRIWEKRISIVKQKYVKTQTRES